MAYTRITRTKNGAAAIAYALSGTGHNGAAKRNEMVTPIKMRNSIDYGKQMNRYWQRARVNHKVQIVRIIQSFSKEEFDPNNPEDILKANEVGQALVEEHYPGRQALICTQTDGKGGCIHNHILINDVSMIDGKGCRKYQYHQPDVMPWTDEITARYTILDEGNKNGENLTQAERAKREKGAYSYKDDIRERVSKAMKSCSSEETFLRKLADLGVNTVKKYSKKCGEHYVYELVDTSEIPDDAKLPNHQLKARSYKLGNAYGPQALKEHLEIYERVAVRSEFTSLGEEYSFKISRGKDVFVEEKSEQAGNEVVSVTAVPIAEDTHAKVLPIDDEEEVEQPKIVLKSEEGKACGKSELKSEKAPKKKRKVDSSRFDRAIQMFDGGYDNDEEDEFGVGE
ncbi:MAG: relaxase/mobilization nuclease domain-containing protein [Ruminococcus sp.]|nr:relaxase/mobilization nuclease domain-containing protein [Ruminococcus sp.]